MQTIKPFFLLLFFFAKILPVFGQSTPVHGHVKDTVVLPHKIDSLAPVIVRPKDLKPRMKGDTMEYNTENIRLRQYANVEELLGRLPGLQIDVSGNITYNGEKIQQLLVDGEDIFGSDPTLITRSFDASKISKVQVLDRKSNQALFTGIDDGSRTKTLNLVLKESAKNGYFGRVDAGANTNGYYNAKGAAASFRKKEQFTALGFAANTGGVEYNSDSKGGYAGISFLNQNADALGASAGKGIPQFVATALHYANTWDGTGDHLIANYQYSHFSTRPVTTTQTLQTQTDSIYGQYQQSQSINQQDQHWFYTTYDLNPAANSAFQFSAYASNSKGKNQLAATGRSTFNDTLVNISQRTIRDDVDYSYVGGSASWRTRIGKIPGRDFVLTTGFAKIDNTTSGYLYSLNQFYQPNGALQSKDTVDQRKEITSHSLNINGGLNYTEPLWKGVQLGFNYGLSITSDDPLQASFDKGDGKYQDEVDSLSSHLKTQVISQRATVTLQGRNKKFNYTIANSWLGYSYRQRDLSSNDLLHLNYSNWAPRVFFNYTPVSDMNFMFIYDASTSQPSIAQLQPVKNNSDPLHISLGNPDLRPGLAQSFKMEFHRFKAWIINGSLNLTLTSNNISTKTTTDSLGRQVSQPVNVDGGRATGFNFSINKKILGLNAGFNTSGTWSRTVSYVNADLSNNDTYTASAGVSLNKYVPDKYTFQLSSAFNYFYAVSSINTSAPVHYWSQNHSGAITLFLLRNFELNTNASYTWQEKTNAFAASTSILIWNSYVSRNFLSNKLTIKAQFNNVLNQNSGISRSNVANVNTETTTNILGRHYLLSAIYHFDKKWKKKAAN